MRHDGWLGLGIRGLLVRDMLGLLVLLRGLRMTRGENKNWLVDHDTRQSSGGYSYRSSPAVETADIPEGLLPVDDSMISHAYLEIAHLLIPSKCPSETDQ
jgi:hypothetical protein